MKILEELTVDLLAEKITHEEFEFLANKLLQPFSEACFEELLGFKKAEGTILYTDDHEGKAGNLKPNATYISCADFFIIGKGLQTKTTNILPQTVNDFVSLIKKSGLDISFK